METDTIKHGETYDLNITAEDADGVAITLDGTWEAACRVTKNKIGGVVIAEPALTFSLGAAVGSIDTRDAEWEPGTYFYDVRLTDPDGNDFWTEPVKLKVEARNTPDSEA